MASADPIVVRYLATPPERKGVLAASLKAGHAEIYQAWRWRSSATGRAPDVHAQSRFFGSSLAVAAKTVAAGHVISSDRAKNILVIREENGGLMTFKTDGAIVQAAGGWDSVKSGAAVEVHYRVEGDTRRATRVYVLAAGADKAPGAKTPPTGD
jgi:hypothetical protein